MCGLFDEEAGFSTLGTALALLLVLSLVFSAGRVYRVTSLSANIQEVADAAALAAQNEVAEYMVVARVCDACVLTLSLTGIAAYGLGLVAMCVPSGAALSAKLLEAGDAVIAARDSFSQNARKALEGLGRALPFLAAANAASVASANEVGSSSGHCIALALLVPTQLTGVSTEQTASEAAQQVDKALGQELGEGAEAIRAAAQKAEDVASEALDIKERAFERDCGDDPDYCMSERAEKLAGLFGGENPIYRSIETWSFEVPLDRAKAYYARRLSIEQPKGSSIEEVVRFELRCVFYRYALQELRTAYVFESDDEVEIDLPLMPTNVDEMRETRMYTADIFPVSTNEAGADVLHAWEGCPGAQGAGRLGSLSQMEKEGYPVCAICGFSATSLGRVGAATGSIESGFEFHYNELVRLAEEYETARNRCLKEANEAKQVMQGAVDALLESLKAVGGHRIDIVPPGSQGVIAIAVSLSAVSASEGFSSLFVEDGAALGTRVAVSAATMIEEDTEAGETVISSLLDNMSAEGVSATDAPQPILECWSLLLEAYGSGQDAVEGALKRVLGMIPTRSASGLGEWAADAFERGVRSMGLQPAKINALKPVLVNSEYVARKGSDVFSERFLALKEGALLVSGPSTSLFSSAISSLEGYVLREIDSVGGKVKVATVELFGGALSIPITIALPLSAVSLTKDFVTELMASVKSAYAQVIDMKVWE